MANAQWSMGSRRRMRSVLRRVLASQTPMTALRILNAMDGAISRSALDDVLQRLVRTGCLFESRKTNGHRKYAQRTYHVTRRGKQLMALVPAAFCAEIAQLQGRALDEVACRICGTQEDIVFFQGGWICGQCLCPDYEVSHGLRGCSAIACD